MSDGERIVRCTIEMDLIEGTHFNPQNKETTEAQAERLAISSFIDILTNSEIEDYVQVKLLE